MTDTNDTVLDTETEVIEPTEPIVDESTESVVNDTEEVEKTNIEVTPDEIEKLRKENNKLQMEINQRRNKEAELEEARQKAELEKLEQEGKWQELAEKMRLDAEAKAQEAERQKVEEFRQNILKDYDKDTRDKAEALNVWWDDASDWTTAEAQIRAKLDLLKPVATTPKDDTEIHPNNPSSLDMGKDFESLPLDEQIKKLQKDLDRAPQR
jgi:excinuclease UvrABC ATPase subunit